MNITKSDVLELRRRLKKNECTFSRLSGCYVSANKEALLKFSQAFSDLEDEEFFKYLEIAKKALSGTLGNNLLELEFSRSADAQERQQFLLTLKASKLKNEALTDRLYEQIIEKYSCAGNYLILLFHDVYDVIAKSTDRSRLDESEEVYEYMVAAVCPVELSRAGLGYNPDENRIGVCARDWLVGAPDIGFLYPAFSGRGSDTSAVMYYAKNPKETHPEFVREVLGCETQRTAAEEKTEFQSIVMGAFGEQTDKADAAFVKIQRTLSGIVADHEEDENQPPLCLTTAAVEGVVAEVPIPEDVQKEITRAYARAFGDMPPVAQNLVDAKLVAASAQRAHTVELEQQLCTLRERLAEKAEADGDAPWDEDASIVLSVPAEKADRITAQVIDGQKCLLIPVDTGESARINGKSAEL